MSTGYTPRKRGVRHPAPTECFSGPRCNLGFAKLSLRRKPRSSVVRSLGRRSGPLSRISGPDKEVYILDSSRLNFQGPDPD